MGPFPPKTSTELATPRTLRILPKANHALLEAKIGNNAEMKSLQRFVPVYSEIVLEWLSKRLVGFPGR